jgi:hypothetical protein
MIIIDLAPKEKSRLCVNAGMDRFLIKPIHSDKFIFTIDAGNDDMSNEDCIEGRLV